MNDDMYKISRIFVTPVSILIGAFAVAPSEPLKTAISALCLIIGILWFVSAWDAWHPKAKLRKKVLISLPILFVFIGFVFTIIHAFKWYSNGTS